MEGLQNIKNSKSGSVYHRHQSLISLVLAQITPKERSCSNKILRGFGATCL
jgi:hypothetical protein